MPLPPQNVRKRKLKRRSDRDQDAFLARGWSVTVSYSVAFGRALLVVIFGAFGMTVVPGADCSYTCESF